MEVHRFHRLPVHGYHGHVEAGDTDIKEGHGAGVDETQLDALAGIELAGPVAVWALAIHQVGIGIPGHIGQIAVAHAHAVPHVAILERLHDAFFADVAQGVEHGAFVEVVVVAQLLEGGVDMIRVCVAPV